MQVIQEVPHPLAAFLFASKWRVPQWLAKLLRPCLFGPVNRATFACIDSGMHVGMVSSSAAVIGLPCWTADFVIYNSFLSCYTYSGFKLSSTSTSGCLLCPPFRNIASLTYLIFFATVRACAMVCSDPSKQTSAAML